MAIGVGQYQGGPAPCHVYPDSQDAMGWNIDSSGFGLVLSADAPAIVERYLADDLTQFLAAHGLDIADVGAWVSHPGGPKVIESIVNDGPRLLFRARHAAVAVTWS
jgi:predicted naringenin-chalcone synthase